MVNISRALPAFKHQRNNLALEGFRVSPRAFAGITCSWFGGAGPRGEDRLLHCSESNQTGGPGRELLGSVQLPSTLYYQLTELQVPSPPHWAALHCHLQGREVSTARNILFTAFSNARLFPQVLLLPHALYNDNVFPSWVNRPRLSTRC